MGDGWRELVPVLLGGSRLGSSLVAHLEEVRMFRFLRFVVLTLVASSLLMIPGSNGRPRTGGDA